MSTRKATYRMSLAEVKTALSLDRYPSDDTTARAVQAAAKAGTLMWTTTRLATMDASRIDVRPFARR